jgi:hypothetical protein
MNDQPTLFDIEHTGIFYNTIKEEDTQLEESRMAVTRQERRVLAIFKIVPIFGLTPFAAWERYCSEHGDVPVTSIRRAITNLTNAGYLEKTEQTVEERWGKVNYIWRIKSG